MRYVSIDIETTGLDPEKCDILSFAAVIEDTQHNTSIVELPRFYKINSDIKYRTIRGQLNGLLMNEALLKRIQNMQGNSIDFLGFEHQLTHEFRLWLITNNFSFNSKDELVFNVAGKNFMAFDQRFLSHNIRDWDRYIKVRHRVMDPGMLFINFKDDEKMPDMNTCIQRSGLDLSKYTQHNALDDARIVVELLRTQYAK